MSHAAPLHTRRQLNWKDLVEVATYETDQDNLSQRIQDAQDAIMDEIEDSFQHASPGERQALTNAMNAMRELRRTSENPRPRRREGNNPDPRIAA